MSVLYDEINKYIKSGKSIIIDTPTGTGKTQAILDILLCSYKGELKGPNNEEIKPDDIVVLCHSRKSATNFKEKVDDELAELKELKNQRTYENILTIPALSYRILKEWAIKNNKELYKFITGPEQDKLIKKLLKKHKKNIFSGENIKEDVADLQVIADKLRDFFEKSSELGLNGQEISKIAKEKNVNIWENVSSIYDEYIKECKSRLSVDHAYLSVLASEVFDENLLQAKLLLIDDAEEMTQSSITLLKKLLENNKKQAICLTTNDLQVNWFRGAIGINTQNSEIEIKELSGTKSFINGKIEYKKFEDKSDEYDFVCSEIQNEYYNNGRSYDDFAVVAHNTSSLNSLKQKFMQYGIPFFFQNNNISLKDEVIYKAFKNIYENKQTSYSPFTLSDDKNADKNNNKKIEFSKENKENDKISAYDWLWKVWNNSIDVDSGLKVGESWQKIVYNKENDWQIYDNYLNTALVLFDEANKKSDEREKYNNIRDFFNALDNQTYLSDNLYNKPRKNIVSFFTPANIKGLHFKNIFLLDVNHGIFPNLKVENSIFLSDELYRYKDLLNTDEFNYSKKSEDLYKSEKRLFNVATSRAENKTYVLATQNDTEFPSEFFLSNNSDIEIVTKDILTGKNRENEVILNEYKSKNVKYGEIKNSEPIIKNEGVLKIRPSELDTLHNCKLKHILDKIQNKNAVSNESIHMEIGTFVHGILEKKTDYNSLSKYKDGNLDEDIQKWIEKNKTRFSENDIYTFELKVVQSIKNALSYYVKIDNEKEKPISLVNEISIPPVIDKDKDSKELQEYKKQVRDEFNNIVSKVFDGIKISGKLDRVDIFDNNIKISDWKTGTKNNAKSKYDLQPLLYSFMLKLYSNVSKAKDSKQFNGKEISSQLVYLGGDKKDESTELKPFTKELEKEIIEKINNIKKELYLPEYKLKENDFCGKYKYKCDYFNHNICPLSKENNYEDN